MAAGNSGNSRSSPSKKRKKPLKPAVKTLVDIRNAGRKASIRSSYASEGSDSDGTPPPSVLAALKPRKVAKLPDLVGKGKGKDNQKRTESNHVLDIIELSDSDSSTKLRPKKRARTGATKDMQNDVIDLCSDEDKEPRVRPPSTLSTDVVVLSSDDEVQVEPLNSSPAFMTPPSEKQAGKKRVSSLHPHLHSSPYSPRSRPGETVHDVYSLFDEEVTAGPSSTSDASSKGTEMVEEPKKLTQQDFIAALKASRGTSSSFSSSIFSVSGKSQTYIQKKITIKYSDEPIYPPLLTPTLFSRTIATMKACPSSRQKLQTKSPAINTASCDPSFKLVGSHASKSEKVDMLVTTTTLVEDAGNTTLYPRSLTNDLNTDLEVQVSASEKYPTLFPSTSLTNILKSPPTHGHSPALVPKPSPTFLVPNHQSSTKSLRPSSSSTERSEGSQLRRSLSVLHLDTADLTASFILESSAAEAEDGDDDLALSDLELGYPS